MYAEYMVILLISILAVIGNMYKEGGRRGDKGFVWTGKEPNGAEQRTEDRDREKRVGEGSSLKDAAVGRDPPNIAVVRGEQRLDMLRLIDLVPENRQMPELEDAD